MILGNVKLINNMDNKGEIIIRSAIKIFVRDGFDKASIADIAKEASISKGTIYLYFSNKEDLVEKTFWHCHNLDVEACSHGIDNHNTSMEKLCQRARNSIRWALSYPMESKLERLYFTSPQGLVHRRYVYQFLHFERTNAIIKEGIDAGEFKDMPSTVIGEVFYGIGGALLYYFEENKELIDDENVWEKCKQIIMDALQK